MRVRVEDTGERLTVEAWPEGGDIGRRDGYRFTKAQLACKKDVIELREPAEVEVSPGVKRGFRMALLHDGSLAVGAKTSRQGAGSITLFESTIPAPRGRAEVTWEWSRLRRVGDL
jgi:hypothetical protein